MKKLFSIVAIAACMASCIEENSQNTVQGIVKVPTDTIPLVTPADKLSYVLGSNLGMGLLDANFKDANLDEVMKGVKGGIDGAVDRMDKVKANALINSFVNKDTSALANKADVAYAYGYNLGSSYAGFGDMSKLNLVIYKKGMQHGFFETGLQIDPRKGDQFMSNYKTSLFANFLEENKKKPGVVTTASGLQYRVIKMGTGKKPGPTDKVSVTYRGTFPDGREFDSSFKTGKPFECSMEGGVIQGWLEGMRLMPVGSKFEFAIPSNLAYGERGQGPIPGGATLLFEIELLAIK